MSFQLFCQLHNTKIIISDELITAIKSDITFSDEELAKPEYEIYWNHSFFTQENAEDSCDSLNSHSNAVTDSEDDSEKNCLDSNDISSNS